MLLFGAKWFQNSFRVVCEWFQNGFRMVSKCIPTSKVQFGNHSVFTRKPIGADQMPFDFWMARIIVRFLIGFRSVSVCYLARSGLRMVSEWFENDLGQHWVLDRYRSALKFWNFQNSRPEQAAPRWPKSERAFSAEQYPVYCDQIPCKISRWPSKYMRFPNNPIFPLQCGNHSQTSRKCVWQAVNAHFYE